MVGVALIVLGIVFLFVGLYHFLIKAPRSRAQFERRTAKTDGTISDVIVKEHKTKRKHGVGYHVTHTYKVTCTYKVSGMEYTLKNIPAALQPAVGDQLAISYNPDDPQDAHVDQYTADPDTNRKAGLGIMGAAVIMCILGFFLK
ncbi:DUF3592 domain-containing protein [Butyrivibrio sp. XPD2002]|jgi:hypothetical protein|uniref:DUF3592 domain-containing protein n=1 Tax=Butyrivibrio sp. XPD2002 TaxID=1280665 RepID=UPI000407C15F|nr:DUF3592 domain-containing protein [Butyrivibrio sp. XPD2002]